MEIIPDSFRREQLFNPVPQLGYTQNSRGEYSSYISSEMLETQKKEKEDEMKLQKLWNALSEEKKKEYRSKD
jgi:hypothetical protein